MYKTERTHYDQVSQFAASFLRNLRNLRIYTNRNLAPDKIQQAKRYALVAICGLALLSVGVHEILGRNGYLARRRRRMQIQTLSAEIQKLKQENVELTRKISDLRSDPEAIEKLAREQLRLGRPGDVVITLSPPDSHNGTAQTEDRSQQTQKSE